MEIEGQKYELEYDPEDPFVVPELRVAYSPQLAEDFMPLIFDPGKYGSKPYPPELIAYRLIIDTRNQRLCILYEVYWKRQECNWQGLFKTHDHDYEQIQVHFDTQTGKKERVVVSSSGPPRYGGHGVEVYSHIDEAKVRDARYTTSPQRHFPWGGLSGKEGGTQIRDIPIEKLFLENGRPTVRILNCYHAFVGLKRKLLPQERIELTPRLEKLDQRLLERWYHRHLPRDNRFGHDISQPFNEPHVMYHPPPADWKSRLAYALLRLFNSLRRTPSP